MNAATHYKKKCPKCNGCKYWLSKICPTCNGTGTVLRKRKK